MDKMETIIITSMKTMMKIMIIMIAGILSKHPVLILL